MGMVEFVSWDQRFFDPIILPGRKPLVTLRDAALYITKLPKAEHDAEEWLAATTTPSARPATENISGIGRRRRAERPCSPPLVAVGW